MCERKKLLAFSRGGGIILPGAYGTSPCTVRSSYVGRADVWYPGLGVLTPHTTQHSRPFDFDSVIPESVMNVAFRTV